MNLSVLNFYILHISYTDWDYRYYLLIVFVPMILLCSIRQLSKLTWVMVFANCCEFYVISVIFYYYFRDPFPDISKRDLVGPTAKLPEAFGIGKRVCLICFKLFIHGFANQAR